METGKKVKEKVKKTAKSVNRENAKKVLLSEGMNPKQKYIILGLSSILIALLLYLGIVFILNHTATVDSVMEEVTLEEYINVSLSKTKEVVYVATRDSKVNKDYESIVLSVLSKRKTKAKFLDLGELAAKNQIIDFMNVIELTKESYTEPMLLIFEDEKVKDSLVGSFGKSEVTAFLDKNRID